MNYNRNLKYVYLPNRGIIKLIGPDVKKFLQNITTTDINRLPIEKALYSLLLNNKGRYLFDFFIVQKSKFVILECAKKEKELLKEMLALYQLNLNFRIRDVSDVYKVGVFFNIEASEKDLQINFDFEDNDKIFFMDPRSSAMGIRVIESKSQNFKEDDSTNFEEYEFIRILNTIPDSERDMIKELSFPLHFNMDKLHSIDFNKGCYPGQEIVARMSRNIIRNRLYTLKFSTTQLPPYGTKIINKHNNQEVGTLLSSMNNIGLGLMEVEKCHGDSHLSVNDKDAKIICKEIIT